MNFICSLSIFESFLFDCLLKLETKTDFYNVVFIAHSEKVLLFSGIFKKKIYYDLKLFISYVFVKKLEL